MGEQVIKMKHKHYKAAPVQSLAYNQANWIISMRLLSERYNWPLNVTSRN